MKVFAPALCEVEWLVPDGALVQVGSTLAWLAPVGHCALIALTAPCSGLVARRTSLLPDAKLGALLAVIGSDAATLRAEERSLLEERRQLVAYELEALNAHLKLHAAAPTLLAADVRKLREWLAEATRVLS